MELIQLFTLIGGSIFFLLGAAHALLTLRDVWRPRAFTPVDDDVRQAMEGTGVRLARARTTMWEAWLGFNLSHGLGAAFFGLSTILIAAYNVSLAARLLPLAILMALIYLALSLRFWFWKPSVGIGLGLFCFLISWGLSLLAA